MSEDAWRTYDQTFLKAAPHPREFGWPHSKILDENPRNMVGDTAIHHSCPSGWQDEGETRASRRSAGGADATPS